MVMRCFLLVYTSDAEVNFRVYFEKIVTVINFKLY